jgi:hypothetical protein
MVIMNLSMGWLLYRIRDNASPELLLSCKDGSIALFIIERKETFHTSKIRNVDRRT